jgi:hypothetical protein
MQLSIDEIIELIEFHGKTLVEFSECPKCMSPRKENMLLTVSRMIELIELLPEHLDAEGPETSPASRMQ